MSAVGGQELARTRVPEAFLTIRGYGRLVIAAEASGSLGLRHTHALAPDAAVLQIVEVARCAAVDLEAIAHAPDAFSVPSVARATLTTGKFFTPTGTWAPASLADVVMPAPSLEILTEGDGRRYWLLEGEVFARVLGIPEREPTIRREDPEGSLRSEAV